MLDRNKNYFSHYVELLIVIWDSSDSNPLFSWGSPRVIKIEKALKEAKFSTVSEQSVIRSIVLSEDNFGLPLWKYLFFFRFNCMICLCPRLEMVSGYCQHRICTQCLYNEDNIRKPSLDKCPTCQKEEAFPVIR